MSHTLFELDVRLREIEPPIWRTVEVPGAWSLEDVHFALQVAMGWTNSHLHQFKIGDKSYGMADIDDSDDLDFEDEREYRLQDLVHHGGSFVYEYDFGDGWEHDVTVKKVTTVSKPPRPRCVAGARACPPEDCGGFSGYANLLEALADPRHEEHESSVTWSNDFKPERFALPKHGLDLREEMETLRAAADGEDPFEPHDIDPDDDPLLDLPKPLVEAVLALEPMQRASLGALIAGSLANELVEVTQAAGQLMGALQERDKKQGARAHRKRARS
jgi:Plasmid pRiA4b ORF-3-like protein